MSKVKLLTILTIGLVVINLVLVGMMIFNRSHHQRDPLKNKRIIIEKLGFDAAQVKAYELLITWHRSQINSLDDSIKMAKKELFLSLSSDGDPNEKDSLLNKLGGLQLSVEGVHYKHFSDIRDICQPEQIPAFDSLMGEVGELFSHRFNKKRENK